jgi:hypothetical protein
MKLPYIFILDIDHTIIGNINYQILEYELLEIIKPELINNFDITEDLNNGMLRPFFKEFISFIKNKYKNVEIFVYTNSSYHWAVNGIIPNIQKVINNVINKPYFTRENSNNNNKLLGNIYDNIIDNLISKYPSLKKDKNKEFVFNNQLVFIDDISENLKDYPEKQILCPVYNYTNIYDIKLKLINKYQIKEEEFDKTEVLDFFNNNGIPIYNKNGSILQQDKIYQDLLELLLIRKSKLENTKKDIFFKSLISIFNKNKSMKLNAKFIERINNHSF